MIVKSDIYIQIFLYIHPLEPILGEPLLDAVDFFSFFYQISKQLWLRQIDGEHLQTSV